MAAPMCQFNDHQLGVLVPFHLLQSCSYLQRHPINRLKWHRVHKKGMNYWRGNCGSAEEGKWEIKDGRSVLICYGSIRGRAGKVASGNHPLYLWPQSTSYSQLCQLLLKPQFSVPRHNLAVLIAVNSCIVSISMSSLCSCFPMTLFAYPSKSLLKLHCIEALSVRIIPILISRPVISSHIDMSN